MTPQEKQKIKLSIITYLKSVGYPNVNSPLEFVIHNLPNIWKHLEKEGLITSQMSYAAFARDANAAYSIAHMQAHFNGIFGFR